MLDHSKQTVYYGLLSGEKRINKINQVSPTADKIRFIDSHHHKQYPPFIQINIEFTASKPATPPSWHNSTQKCIINNTPKCKNISTHPNNTKLNHLFTNPPQNFHHLSHPHVDVDRATSKLDRSPPSKYDDYYPLHHYYRLHHWRLRLDCLHL